VPFVFLTGYGRESVDRRYSAIQILEKPIERQTLEGLFATVLKTTGDYRKPVRRARAN